MRLFFVKTLFALLERQKSSLIYDLLLVRLSAQASSVAAPLSVVVAPSSFVIDLMLAMPNKCGVPSLTQAFGNQSTAHQTSPPAAGK